MNTTSRVLVAMGAVTLMTYGSALAQQAPAAATGAPVIGVPRDSTRGLIRRRTG